MNNILVIDDEDNILRSMRRVLTYFGYGVKLAHDGEEGIELFKNGHNFDLVITDICMPGMNGNDVARFIRSTDKSNTPIIAITGHGADDINRDMFNFLLMKPFKLETLIDVVRSYM